MARIVKEDDDRAKAKGDAKAKEAALANLRNPTALMPDLLDQPCCLRSADVVGGVGGVGGADVLADFADFSDNGTCPHGDRQFATITDFGKRGFDACEKHSHISGGKHSSDLELIARKFNYLAML